MNTLHDFDSLRGGWPSPDGELLVYISDSSGTPQPWIRTWDGEARLLPVEGAVVRCAWRPDSRRVLVQADLAGTEHYRLAEVDPATGEVVWLAAEQDVRYEIGTPYGSSSEPYSPDGRLLAFASNARDSSCFDVLVRDLATGVDRTVLQSGEVFPADRYLPMFFSPDSRQLLIVRLHQNTEHDLFACDLETGELTHLTPHDGPAKYLPGGWTEDGIYLCTTEGRDHLGVALLTPGEPLEWLDTPDTDVESVVAGRRVLWAFTEGQQTRMRLLDPATGVVTDVEGLPAGVFAEEFGMDGMVPRFTGRGAVLLVSRADRASELWLADLEGGSARRLTDCGARLPEGLITPETVWFTSADGVAVSALLYRPSTSDDEPVPAVVHIHGGPEASALPVYNPLIQDLLAQGIAVLAPNARGSSGRGLHYQRLVYRDWGGGDLEDFAAAAAFLGSLSWVDADRLGVYGASYGGFASLSCLSRLPDLWRVGVCECGPADLITDIRAFPPTWARRATDWIGDPDDPADAAMLTERSPLSHVEAIRAPLLLVHGTADTRVDIGGTELFYARLTELGRPVKLIRLEGEGHDPTDKESRSGTESDIIAWFRAHLVEIER